jgi:hypothetical protein
MDQDPQIKTELLKTLRHFKGLNDADFRLLVKIVEESLPKIKYTIHEIMSEYIQMNSGFGLDKIIQVLMKTGLMNGKNNPLYDPEHKKWSDMQKCDILLRHTIEWYVRVGYGLGEAEVDEAIIKKIRENHKPEDAFMKRYKELLRERGIIINDKNFPELHDQ